MGSPSRTRRQTLFYFSCWGPSLPWLLQPQSLSLLLLLSPTLMLIPGTATDTVATDGADTTDLMATMATTERDQRMPSQRPLLPLILTLTLMRGTATMATDTVDMDTVATTGPMATTATTERDLQMPSLSQLLPLSPTLMLIPGIATDTVATDGAATTGLMVTTATMERDPLMLSLLPSLQLMLQLTPLLMLMPGTVDTATVDTATGDTTAHMDMGVTGEVTGAKQTNREVYSSSDCDFPSTLASISRACA